MGDEGQLEQANQVLSSALSCIQASPSGLAQSELCNGLIRDLANVQQGFSNEHVYRSWGSKQSKMSSACHYQQRSSHTTGGTYSKKSKMRMMERFHEEDLGAGSSAPPT